MRDQGICLELPLSAIFSSCPVCLLLSHHLLSSSFLFCHSCLGITACKEQGAPLDWQILATAASATRSILKTEKAKRELESQGCGGGKVSDENGGGLYYLFLLESLFSCSNAVLQELVKANMNGPCDAAVAFSGVRARTQENYSLLLT